MDANTKSVYQTLRCPCGCRTFQINMKDFPALKDEKGKVIRPALTSVKVLVCDCGSETMFFQLLHGDSRLEWVDPREETIGKRI